MMLLAARANILLSKGKMLFTTRFAGRIMNESGAKIEWNKVPKVFSVIV